MLNVSHISKYFKSGFLGNKSLQVLDDVSFEIDDCEIFGLIGGSGSGKTTLSRIILGPLFPDEGSVSFEGKELLLLNKKEWKETRKDIQIVFQNPQKTFNPRFTVYECCAEPLRQFDLCESKQQEEQKVREMLDWVGVSHDQLYKYPHEISGGQAQRVAIARTLVLNPKLIICDEPTSMLDISVQAQIIDLLRHVNKDRKTALLFISHDLDVVRYFCNRVAVIEKGRIVELGKTDEVFSNPKSEYAKQLFSSVLS